MYGQYEIPVAFVKGKLGVFVDAEGAASACRKALEDEGWVIVNYSSADVTDGATQAEELKDLMKSQLRALKKGKKKRKA